MSNRSAPTNGWDTVFALKLPDVNTHLATAGTSPKSFAYPSPECPSDEDWSISAQFGAWQVHPKSSGKILRMLAPITSGITTDSSKKTHSFKNVHVTFEIQLEFLNSAKQPKDASEGVFLDLKPKCSPVEDDDGTQDAVTAVTATFADGKNHSTIKDRIESALDNWLNKNLYLFNHVFATVNLNRKVATGQFQWIYPTYTNYTFVEATKPENSVLGVLCMTENRDYEGLTSEMTSNAIPKDSKAGFLINKGRFLKKLLKPALKNAFKNSKDSDYTMSEDGNSVQLAAGCYPEFEIKDKDNNSHKAFFESLNISCQENTILMESRCKTEISPGIWAHTSSIHSYKLVLQNNANGNPSFIYKEVGSPTINHWVEYSEGVNVAKIAALVVGILAGIVVAALTSGFAFIMSALIIGLVSGLAYEMPTIIGNSNKDKAPDLNLFLLNVTAPIVWTSQKVFKLNWAGLNDSLQLGGEYV